MKSYFKGTDMKYLLFTLVLLFGGYVLSTAITEILKKRKEHNLKSPLSVDIMTVCKGVSITIIMIAHVGNLFGTRLLNPLGSLGVAVFLFASGYGLERSFEKKGLKDYWKKRIKTAYVPYALIEVVNCLFGISHKIQGEGIGEIILDFLLIKPLHPFGWYMQCLFLYYGAFYIGSLLSRKKAYLKYVVIGLLSVVLFIFARSLFKQQLLAFIIGVFCGQYYKKLAPYFGKIPVGIISLGIGGGALLLKQLSVIRNLPELLFFGVEVIQVTGLMIFLIVFVHLICRYLPQWMTETPRLVGIISNELYLIHGLIFSLVIYDKKMSYKSLVIFFLLSFGISIAVYVIKNLLLKLGAQVNEKSK